MVQTLQIHKSSRARRLQKKNTQKVACFFAGIGTLPIKDTLQCFTHRACCSSRNLSIAIRKLELPSTAQWLNHTLGSLRGTTNSLLWIGWAFRRKTYESLSITAAVFILGSDMDCLRETGSWSLARHLSVSFRRFVKDIVSTCVGLAEHREDFRLLHVVQKQSVQFC